MLCVKCKEREATVHFDMIEGEKISKIDFCIECAGPEFGVGKGTKLERWMELLKSGSWSPGPTIKEALGQVGKYPIDAYEFVREALDNCLEVARASGGDSNAIWEAVTVSRLSQGHVSGRRLLEGIRQLALKKFGKRAKAALAEWRIFRTEDFGEIVFEMIEGKLMTKQPGDSKEDFKNGFSFEEAFPDK